MTKPNTPSEWTRWAEAAAPRLADRAAAAEALRSVPEETIREAAEAGYFALLAPTTAGGAGASMADFLDVGRRLAAGCPSSAWTLSFLAMHVWLLCRFEPQLQDELFAGGAMPLAPAPLAPTGTAEAVPGGYRISGRWEWATGVNHSDWVMVNAMDGPMPRFCVLPIADVEVEDVWRTAGMCATGSNLVTARDVFVPAHRTLSAMQMKFGPMPGLARHPGGTVGYAMSPALALVAAAPALGAAEGALAAFTARMKAKIQAYSGGAKQSDAPATHLRLGEALATVRAARLVWADAVALYEREGPMGAAMPVESLAAVRLAAADVVRLANIAVNTMCAAAGASSGFQSSPLQRYLRDVQMIRGHVVFDWDRAAQIGGRIALGLEATPADLL
ncbi:MAG: acyl-CoA dehydrogenase family protein [Caulobacter sp.]|nr:acyl-CoA dehydrogenase family protein [Caulobacter sp.]